VLLGAHGKHSGNVDTQSTRRKTLPGSMALLPGVTLVPLRVGPVQLLGTHTRTGEVGN